MLNGQCREQQYQLYTQVFGKLHTLPPTVHQKRLAIWVCHVVGLAATRRSSSHFCHTFAELAR
jgi:hypothetical protein